RRADTRHRAGEGHCAATDRGGSGNVVGASDRGSTASKADRASPADCGAGLEVGTVPAISEFQPSSGRDREAAGAIAASLQLNRPLLDVHRARVVEGNTHPGNASPARLLEGTAVLEHRGRTAPIPNDTIGLEVPGGTKRVVDGCRGV